MQNLKVSSEPTKKNSKCSRSPQTDIIYPEEFRNVIIARVVKLSKNHERSMKIILLDERKSFHRELLYLKEHGGS